MLMNIFEAFGAELGSGAKFRLHKVKVVFAYDAITSNSGVYSAVRLR